MKYTLDIPPKPQSRPRFGNGRAYEQKDMKKWKQELEYLLMIRKPKIIDKGAIHVAMTFYIYPPQNISKVKTKHPVSNESLEKIYVDKKPDIDNYVKAVLDASNGLLFKDDRQVAVLTTQKLYSLNPRIELEITKLEENKCLT